MAGTELGLELDRSEILDDLLEDLDLIEILRDLDLLLEVLLEDLDLLLEVLLEDLDLLGRGQRGLSWLGNNPSNSSSPGVSSQCLMH